MSLMLIGQIWLCLLSAFGLGLFVGWLWKQLSSSQKHVSSLRRNELPSHGREGVAKEREITTTLTALRTQMETATATLQKREETLAKLETGLTERVATLSVAAEQTEKLQTRLTETEATLQQNMQSARTLEAEVHTLRTALGNKDQEFHRLLQLPQASKSHNENTTKSESRIAELTTYIHAVLQEKEAVISGLQSRVATLEPLKTQLSECTSTLQEAETYYQTAVRDKDAEIIRLQAHISTLQLSAAEGVDSEAKLTELKARHQSIVREKDAMLARLQARIAGLELLLHRKSDPITVPLQFSPSVHHRTPTSFPRESLTTKPKSSATDLTEIKSLNDEYVPSLREAGITTRAALLEKGMSPEGRSEIAAKTGIPAMLILHWVRHADLLRLNGMSGIYAELLDAAGVDSVTTLTKCTAETLHQKFLDVNAAKRLSRILPILAQIRDWIEQAKQLPRTSEELRLSVVGQAP